VPISVQTLGDRIRAWWRKPRTPAQTTRLVLRAAAGVTALAVLVAVLDATLSDPPLFIGLALSFVERLLAVALLADPFLRLRLAPSRFRFFRSNWPDAATGSLAVATLVDDGYFGPLVLARIGVMIAKRFLSPEGGEALAAQLLRHPARLLALSFAATILGGTVLLMLPAATADGRGTPFLDALFTATSATCVTGLTVRDTATFFSPLGQLVVILLVQVGGLGIMTLSTAIATLVGRRVSARQQIVAQESIAASELAPDLRRMLRAVLVYTLIIEAVGTLLLLAPFFELTGDFPSALARAAFHSVSAFCNAGFALQTDNLEPLRTSLVVNLVIPALVLAGGFGFVVLADFKARGLPRRRGAWGWRRLHLHSRLVLVVSGALVVVGALYIFFGEFNGTLRAYPLSEKAMASFFLSVSSRTAGFNTIPMGELADGTLFVLVLLMFVGGSPGSTAGGIKTTTLAILLLTVRTTVLGRGEVEVSGRTIVRRAIYTAVATTVLSSALVVLVSLILFALETPRFLPLLFEATSAFGTVGLSTGITPDLTGVGKILLIVLMYVGRLGPVTLALAVARRTSPSPVVYPEAEIQVG
jgi:trk system potassium uptake protein TrkH